MGVISQISVGDVMYYQVDDIPTHTAPKGSVAIMSGSTYTNGFTYVNNDGGTTWLKCITPSYGEIYLSNATNTADFEAQTVGSFYPFNTTPTGAAWTLSPDSSSDWFLATENGDADDLEYSGTPTMRVFASTNLTVRGGSAKWVSYNITTAQNFSVITTSLNSFYTADNGATANCTHNTIREVGTNDYLLPAVSPIAREGGGGAATRSVIFRHAQLSCIKIDEPLVNIPLFLEDWESSGFTENGWTVVNDDPNDNVWVVGQAENNTAGGTSAAYITTYASSGASATYAGNGTSDSISHIWRDFEIPNNATLSFDWIANGSGTDFGALYIQTTGYTVTAGVRNSPTTGATGGSLGRLGGNTASANEFNGFTGWQSESIDLSAWGGGTYRLIWEWFNNSLSNTPPGFIIDNIKITIGDDLIY
jgi:hypothetical protein